MQHKQCDGYECKLTIGSREGYHGPHFSRNDLIGVIQSFQECYPEAIPVMVTSTCSFVHKKQYREDGWEVSVIKYPNHLRDEKFLHDYLTAMAEHLADKFKQNRITVRGFRSPVSTVMVEQVVPEPWADK